MPTRAIYETTFDEDVQPDANANQCPECGGRVTTTTVETVCDDCGLVIDSASEWQGPERGRPRPVWSTGGAGDGERR